VCKYKHICLIEAATLSDFCLYSCAMYKFSHLLTYSHSYKDAKTWDGVCKIDINSTNRSAIISVDRNNNYLPVRNLTFKIRIYVYVTTPGKCSLRQIDRNTKIWYICFPWQVYHTYLHIFSSLSKVQFFFEFRKYTITVTTDHRRDSSAIPRHYQAACSV